MRPEIEEFKRATQKQQEHFMKETAFDIAQSETTEEFDYYLSLLKSFLRIRQEIYLALYEKLLSRNEPTAISTISSYVQTSDRLIKNILNISTREAAQKKTMRIWKTLGYTFSLENFLLSAFSTSNGEVIGRKRKSTQRSIDGTPVLRRSQRGHYLNEKTGKMIMREEIEDEPDEIEKIIHGYE